jgi:NAD(P)-dependent dehydrogenase (short-subunit alcohol dehydrogenase family)
MFDLTGKVALVTGGSRGLGRSMVLGLAEAGADVVVVSRKLEACEAVAEDVRRRFGRRALPVACHVGSWRDLDGLVETAYAELGKVDVLVNNAGMSPLYPSVGEITEELFDKVIGVNLKGAFRLAASIGSRMAAGDGGSIINVSSTAGIHPTPIEIPYAMAKAGLNNMTLGLARTLGPTVRVNTIMPGPFLTDISASWDMDAMLKMAKREIPMARIGEPIEIVGAALYLASAASSYTTGAIIKIDGGWA